jgi:mRNA interferase RelE/StbE
MYKVFYSKQAVKALRKLPKALSRRICGKIDLLAAAPHQYKQSKILAGMNASRLRVGDWRIIYSIDNGRMEILIIKVAPRGEVYKR